jgi:hypothetical protein
MNVLAVGVASLMVLSSITMRFIVMESSIYYYETVIVQFIVWVE